MAARRRTRSGLVALIVVATVLALLVGGLLLADRYAAQQVQQRASVALQGELGTPAPPRIEVLGRPFLTQVLAGRIRTVHVVGDDVGTTTEAALVAKHLDLTLTDLVSSDRFQTLTVSHAEGTALVGYDQLQARAGVPLSYVGGGRVQVESDTKVLGVDVKARINGGLGLDAGAQTVSLTDPDVTVNGVHLPDVTAGAILRTVLKPIPVTGVPFGLRLTSVTAADDGVQAGLVGDNIPVRR